MTYRYGPYGEVVGVGSAGYGFTGEQWHAEVGLLYLRAWYYAPGVGRFVSRDVLDGETLWPLTLHRFIYVLDRPTRYVDPQGLQCSLDIFTGEKTCFGENTGMGQTATLPDVVKQVPGEYATSRGYHYQRGRYGEVVAQYPPRREPWELPYGIFTNLAYVRITEANLVPATRPLGGLPYATGFASPAVLWCTGPALAASYRVELAVLSLEYQEGSEVWIWEKYVGLEALGLQFAQTIQRVAIKRRIEVFSQGAEVPAETPWHDKQWSRAVGLLPAWQISPRNIVLPGTGPDDLEHFRWVPREEGRVLEVDLTNWVSIDNPAGPGTFGSLVVKVRPR